MTLNKMMRKAFFFLILPILLASCTKEDGQADKLKQNETTRQTVRHENTKTVRVRGGIHFSFERAEFRYKNEKYFLIDEHQLLNKMISADRNRQKSYEVTLENVCLEGYEKTASQNNGKTFGPLGQYEKAFVVKGVCYL